MFANKQIETDIDALTTPRMKAQFYALLFSKYVIPDGKLMAFMTTYVVPAIKQMQGGDSK